MKASGQDLIHSPRNSLQKLTVPILFTNGCDKPEISQIGHTLVNSAAHEKVLHITDSIKASSEKRKTS